MYKHGLNSDWRIEEKCCFSYLNSRVMMPEDETWMRRLASWERNTQRDDSREQAKRGARDARNKAKHNSFRKSLKNKVIHT